MAPRAKAKGLIAMNALTLRERMKQTLAVEMTGRLYQTGRPSALGAAMRELLADCFEEDAEFAALSEAEQQYLLDDVCPEDVEFRASPLHLVPKE